MPPENRDSEGRFRPGATGNAGGRPHKLRELESAIEEAHAGPKVLAVIEKLHDLAVGGDVNAAKVYLDRVLGPLRPRSDVLPPPIATTLTAERIQTAVRGLLAGQVLALAQKAQAGGLTDPELSVLKETAKSVREADRDLESLRLLESMGLGG